MRRSSERRIPVDHLRILAIALVVEAGIAGVDETKAESADIAKVVASCLRYCVVKL